jgi:hypothetical protein
LLTSTGTVPAALLVAVLEADGDPNFETVADGLAEVVVGFCHRLATEVVAAGELDVAAEETPANP